MGKKIAIYNRKGILIKDHHLNSSIGGRGLNSLNVSSEKVIIPFTTALGIYNTKNEQVDFIHGLNLKYTYTGWQNKQIVRDRFAHDPLIANQLIKYNNEECVVVLFQEDYAVEGSQALVSIIGIESKTIHNRLHLPSGSEFAPHISDVNNDGKLDLLVGCYDGKLYSYNMGIPSRNMLIKEKKYSISVSVENEELDKLNLVNETNEDSGKNAGDIALEQEEIKNNEAENITNKTDLNSKEEGISTANIYLISYASLALLLFVGASIYLFRNKQEEVLVDQS